MVLGARAGSGGGGGGDSKGSGVAGMHYGGGVEKRNVERQRRRERTRRTRLDAGLRRMWLRYKNAFSSKQKDGANHSVRSFLFWAGGADSQPSDWMPATGCRAAEVLRPEELKSY